MAMAQVTVSEAAAVVVATNLHLWQELTRTARHRCALCEKLLPRTSALGPAQHPPSFHLPGSHHHHLSRRVLDGEGGNVLRDCCLRRRGRSRRHQR